MAALEKEFPDFGLKFSIGERFLKRRMRMRGKIEVVMLCGVIVTLFLYYFRWTDQLWCVSSWLGQDLLLRPHRPHPVQGGPLFWRQDHEGMCACVCVCVCVWTNNDNFSLLVSSCVLPVCREAMTLRSSVIHALLVTQWQALRTPWSSWRNSLESNRIYTCLFHCKVRIEPGSGRTFLCSW